MKKFIKLTLIFTLIFVNAFPVYVFASEETPQWEDAEFSEEELAEIYALGTELVFTQRATGLILSGTLGIAKSGATLALLCEVFCSLDVKKCGFKEIVIQRSTSSSGGWVDITTYEDLYADYSVYSIQKTFVLIPDYYYRATCIFYAKKNIFSVQKEEAVSNIVFM